MAASLVYCGAVPCAIIVFAVCSSAFAVSGKSVLTAFWLAAAFSDRTFSVLS